MSSRRVGLLVVFVVVALVAGTAGGAAATGTVESPSDHDDAGTVENVSGTAEETADEGTTETGNVTGPVDDARTVAESGTGAAASDGVAAAADGAKGLLGAATAAESDGSDGVGTPSRVVVTVDASGYREASESATQRSLSTQQSATGVWGAAEEARSASPTVTLEVDDWTWSSEDVAADAGGVDAGYLSAPGATDRAGRGDGFRTAERDGAATAGDPDDTDGVPVVGGVGHGGLAPPMSVPVPVPVPDADNGTAGPAPTAAGSPAAGGGALSVLGLALPLGAALVTVALKPWTGFVSALFLAVADWLSRVLAAFRFGRGTDADPLDHETRVRIDELVTESPGYTLSELSEELATPLSTVRHHVRILEREGALETEKHRGNRRLYPLGAGPDELAAALEDESSAAVVEALYEQGSATVGDIVEALDRSYSTVSYHLSRLVEDGIVVQEKDGRRTVSRLEPSVESRFESLREERGDGPASEAGEREAMPTD